MIDAVPLWWRFHQSGWNQALRGVPERLYCSACWERTTRRVRGPRLIVTRQTAPPGGLLFPDERDWRRTVARYRS